MPPRVPDISERGHVSSDVIKVLRGSQEFLEQRVHELQQLVHLLGALLVESLAVRKLPRVGLSDEGPLEQGRHKQHRPDVVGRLQLFYRRLHLLEMVTRELKDRRLPYVFKLPLLC